MQTLNVTISWLENYGAYSDDIPGVVATHDTLEGVKEAFIEALEFHFEGITEVEFEDLPFNPRKPFQINFDLNVRALLKTLNGIVSIATISRYSGINQRQLGHYLAGIKRPRKIQKDKIINGLHDLKMDLTHKTESITIKESIID